MWRSSIPDRHGHFDNYIANIVACEPAEEPRGKRIGKINSNVHKDKVGRGQRVLMMCLSK